MRFFRLAAAALIALSACSKPAVEKPEEIKAAPSEPKVEALRLYVLDCGHIDVSDMGVFDKGGAYNGQKRSLVDACFLVRHPSGDLLWDSGLPDAIHDAPDGVVNEPFKLMMPKTLKGQLDRLGVPFRD